MQWVINAVAIVIAVRVVDGISFRGEWWHMLIIGAIFGVINGFIKPVIKFFTYPIIIITLGIFVFIINAAMLGLTALISNIFKLGFEVNGFVPAFWGALIVSVVGIFLSWITGTRSFRRQRVKR